MNPELRVVTRIPMVEFWHSHGAKISVRKRPLKSADIRSMLHDGLVRFVVADCGHALSWIPASQCCEFWNTELKPRLVETETFELSDFPDQYCYIASEWQGHDGEPHPIVLMEKYH